MLEFFIEICDRKVMDGYFNEKWQPIVWPAAVMS
jgi:hypothetical protein